MKISYGNGGWCRVAGDLELPGVLYVRVQEVDGRLRITELYLDGRGEPIGAAGLRKLPLAALEHWIATEYRPSLLGIAGPDLARLAAHYATTWGTKARNWVADSWRAQYPASDVRQVPMPEDRDEDAAEPGEVVLHAPEDGRLTDAFLGDVARAYSAAIARREPPAQTLAKLAGVSPRTVHRWVYTARKRGIMQPAESRGRIV